MSVTTSVGTAVAAPDPTAADADRSARPRRPPPPPPPARWVIGAVAGLIGIVAVWTRLVGIDQSMWNDELYSVLRYIQPGPSGIWFGHYVPNDHVLFELLTWATVHLAGTTGDAGYRFWGVVPALAALAVMTVWLWRRQGRWVGLALGRGGAGAPVALQYGVQARGYGLCFLAGALLTIGAVALADWGTLRAQALFIAAALLGIWTIPVFVLDVVGMALPIATLVDRRRRLAIALGVIAVLTLVFYAPLLTAIAGSSSQQFGLRLPWYGFITGPLTDQLTPDLSLVFPGLPQALLAVIAGALLLGGAARLWRRGDRSLAAVGLSAPLFAYVVIDLARFYTTPRFTSYLLVPMLALVAVGLVDLFRAAAGLRGCRLGVELTAATLIGLALVDALHLAAQWAVVPFQNSQTAVALVKDTAPAEPIITDSRDLGFQFYLGVSHYARMSTADAQRWFCTRSAAFIYLEFPGDQPAPNVSCLIARHATSVRIAQRSPVPLAVWFAPAQTVAPTKAPAPARSTAVSAGTAGRARHPAAGGSPAPVRIGRSTKR
jgi:hypothetical protein